MGQQIVRQPNGLYAVWSTIVDAFVLLDATPEDIIQDWNVRDEARNRERVEDIVAKLKKGEKPYYQFTETWASFKRYLRRHFPEHDVPDEEKLASKEDAKKRLKKSSKNKGYYMWLHIPKNYVVPEKPEDAVEEEWQRVTVWQKVVD